MHPYCWLAPGLVVQGLLRMLFRLYGFCLFGFLLPSPFGLVLLAFLVAHRVTPFWRNPLHIAARRLLVIYGLGQFPLFRGQFKAQALHSVCRIRLTAKLRNLAAERILINPASSIGSNDWLAGTVFNYGLM